jgi:hypothetical protein
VDELLEDVEQRSMALRRIALTRMLESEPRKRVAGLLKLVVDEELHQEYSTGTILDAVNACQSFAEVVTYLTRHRIRMLRDIRDEGLKPVLPQEEIAQGELDLASCITDPTKKKIMEEATQIGLHAYHDPETIYRVVMQADSIDDVLQRLSGLGAILYEPSYVVDVRKVQLPQTWTDMTGTEFKLEEISHASEEFQNVVDRFALTCAFPLQAVHRVQNSILWRLYCDTRSLISRKSINMGNANEHYLFHGPMVPGSTDLIVTAGFDHQLSTKSPFGVRLSTNAGCCIQHAEASSDGTSRLILVRTTLGYVGRADETGCAMSIVEGLERADSHHCELQSYGHQRIDDQVDNCFVIFNNYQMYPEFVITFDHTGGGL